MAKQSLRFNRGFLVTRDMDDAIKAESNRRDIPASALLRAWTVAGLEASSKEPSKVAPAAAEVAK